MTFENIQFPRVLRGVAVIWVAGIILSFLASCLLIPMWPQELSDRLTNTLEQSTKKDADYTVLQKDLESVAEDYQTELTVNYSLQWMLVSIVTYIVARRTAAAASSPQQAAGYGVAVGVGVAMTYGVLCVMCSIALLVLRLLFFVVLAGAGLLGGQTAGRNLDPEQARRAAAEAQQRRAQGSLGGSSLRAPVPSGTNPEIYYNMGITAAVGGRPDEARQHFKHVLQMQPRHIPAWLQLANLSGSPEEAWQYIQQARAIDASDPAVVEAVNIIWPQVAARAAGREQPPHAQPPYQGAEDDVSSPPRTVPPPQQMVPPEAPEAGPDDKSEPDDSSPLA